MTNEFTVKCASCQLTQIVSVDMQEKLGTYRCLSCGYSLALDLARMIVKLG